ncbi:MAG: hypothetical protein V9E99_11065 [Microthrixaceae bacterium]
MRRRSLAVGAVAALAATLTTACGEVDPIGSVDWAVGGVESVTVAGWAWDQDRGEAPTTLHVYVDGAYRLSGVTTVARPDVGALYPGSGETRGYGLTVSVAPGSHEVCVYAINEGEGTTNPLLGCKAATATAAAGCDRRHDPRRFPRVPGLRSREVGNERVVLPAPELPQRPTRRPRQ